MSCQHFMRVFIFYTLAISLIARSAEDMAVIRFIGSIKQQAEKIKQFKHIMRLIVDKFMPGFGSTTDENVVRHFFNTQELSAQFTRLQI